ncbi:MAG: beta-propeller fold lactonase family protein, partial [Planctomycetota bacterium]|nr:beta-propeller fold lactonase family protein [Planctomycetota bacterium]
MRPGTLSRVTGYPALESLEPRLLLSGSVPLVGPNLLTVGNRWEYVAQDLAPSPPEPQTGTLVRAVVKNQDEGGFAAAVVRETFSVAPGFYSDDYMVMSGDYLLRLRTDTPADWWGMGAGLLTDIYTNPLEVLPLRIDVTDVNRPLGDGGAYDIYNNYETPDVWKGNDEALPMTCGVSYLGAETITVRAGTFACAKVFWRQSETDPAGEEVEESTMWVNADVGIIKEEVLQYDLEIGTREVLAQYSLELAKTNVKAPSGSLSPVEVLRNGVGAVDGLEGARSVTLSPDGKHVYAAGAEDNAVAVFSRDTKTGQLSFQQVLKDGEGGVDGLAGAYSVTISGDGKHVYVAGFHDNAVAVFSRDTKTGQLSFRQVLKDRVDGVDGLAGATSVTVSPDGKHVYAAGLGDNAVAVFSRDTRTGQLSFRQVLKEGVDGVDGLDYVYSVTVSRDGKYV